jgi:hypothetical protein
MLIAVVVVPASGIKRKIVAIPQPVAVQGGVVSAGEVAGVSVMVVRIALMGLTSDALQVNRHWLVPREMRHQADDAWFAPHVQNRFGSVT